MSWKQLFKVANERERENTKTSFTLLRGWLTKQIDTIVLDQNICIARASMEQRIKKLFVSDLNLGL